MTYHASPLPTNATTRPEPVHTPPPPPPPRRAAAPTIPTATPARSDARPSTAPWYRREPWLSVALAAFVPIAIGFATPQTFHALLLGASTLLVLVSIALLVRQGPFRGH